jgi:hypothetical protein
LSIRRGGRYADDDLEALDSSLPQRSYSRYAIPVEENPKKLPAWR